MNNESEKEKLIYIENTHTDPHYNLAFEEYVFQNLPAVAGESAPVLLLWQNEPSVIVGKYQNTIEEINYDYIETQGVHVVRRNTGGGAVYHDLGNLNYSFIIPDAQTKVDFKTFTTPIVKALNSYGIPAEQTGRNDLVVGDRKFSGNAQQFSKHRLLHHGTIMFDVDTEAVAKALRVKPGKFKSKATKSVRSRVTNLKPYFEGGQNPDDPDGVSAAAGTLPGAAETTAPADAAGLKALLLAWFRREYDVIDIELTEEQLAEVTALKESKYDTHEWNLGRSPKADVVRGDFFRCGHVEFNFTIDHHRISKAEIRGDFFPARDIGEFEAAFEGCEYTAEALAEVLARADLEGYLGDVIAEELLAVIV